MKKKYLIIFILIILTASQTKDMEKMVNKCFNSDRWNGNNGKLRNNYPRKDVSALIVLRITQYLSQIKKRLPPNQ